MKDWQKLLLALIIIFLVFFGIAKISQWSDEKAIEEAGKEWAESVRNNK